MSIVTLTSGGMDSTLMAYLTKLEGVQQFPLFINYGQLSYEQEALTCRKVFEQNGLPQVTEVNLSGYGELLPCGITNTTKDIYKDAFLPGRNSLFLLVGASYATQVGASTVSIGLLNEQAHLFPDQTQDFIVAAENFLSLALGTVIKVITPLSDYSKKDVIGLAQKYELDHTYSCHSGNDEPCGVCISCKEILTAEGRS